SLEASLSCRFCGRNPQDFSKIRRGCRGGALASPSASLSKKIAQDIQMNQTRRRVRRVWFFQSASGGKTVRLVRIAP
ncbi:MAG: hypothetical protein PUD50_03125, partial [Eubacteriales bacterium]|nr:hypothetical protein [Eubacteriales bacterium]